MEKGTEPISFYVFWIRQYQKRNPTILAAARTITDCTEKLYESGLYARSEDQNINILDPEFCREPTAEEQHYAHLISEAFTHISEFSYKAVDVLDKTPSADEIVLAAYNQDEQDRLYNSLEDQSPCNINRCIAIKGAAKYDTNNPCSKFYSFDIDVFASDNAIISALLSEIHVIRLNERNCDFDYERCQLNCSKWEKCFSIIYDNNDKELSATYRHKSGYSYKIGSFAPRAVGLWLWEYCCENGGLAKHSTATKAFRALEHQLWPRISNGRSFPEDRQLRTYLTKTADCIAAGKILPFSTPRQKDAQRV